MTNPKILTLDIETSPLITATFTLWPKSIHPDNVLQDWYVLTASWKWLGKKTIHGAICAKGGDDMPVLEKLHQAMDEADIWCGHNIDRFDFTKINTRFIQLGLPPLAKKKTIDTYKMAKRDFGFTSNKLDFICDRLDIGRKIETPKGLWLRALDGDRKALREMLRYNKGDVEITEKLYLKLRPYSSAQVNMSSYIDDRDLGNKLCCTKCGSDNLKKNGLKVLASGKYQQYQCLECGGWSRGRKNLRTKKETGVKLEDQTLASS